MRKSSDSDGTTPAAFLQEAESRLLALTTEANRADWVYQTHITEDTETLSTQATARLISATTQLAQRSMGFSSESLSTTEARKIRLLRLSLPIVAPAEPRVAEDLARRVSSMSSTYAKERYTPRGQKEPLDLQALSRILEESRDPAVLEEVWTGWHRVGRRVRSDFVPYVELANRGARELGFGDLGSMWRSSYDMDPEDFAREVDRLWLAVRPLFRSLHAFVRRRLVDQYGRDRVPASGGIPVFLLGDMWAQSWEKIYPLLARPLPATAYNLTDLLRQRNTTPLEMVRYGERFFDSLGFEPLPSTFWERSMFVRPPGREVVCHASAWDVDCARDVRLKMCLEITADDFMTVHHELGHVYYQRAYSDQPFLFRGSAHDGFHEAVGDAVALSITPEYLARVGLLETVPGLEGDVGLLLHRALEKVAFLPFALVVDRWRWRVFSGEIGPSDYNRTWWEMRREYQGVEPPPGRAEGEFDPGAKYHIPSSTPYIRYFLALILQFQFHRALARTAGIEGPLHRASIYGSRSAGERLREMLALGSSREWPDALEALTGDRRMDADALLEYFAPLQPWLDDQNQDVPVGW